VHPEIVHAGQVSRCQGGTARHTYNRRSLPSGWLNGRQSIRVWVFPPTELIGQASFIYNWEALPSEAAAIISPHPTLSESIGESFLALAGKPLHTM